MLLVAEQAGRQEAATNAHSVLRTSLLEKTIKKDQPGGSESVQEAGMGQSASPDGLTHGECGG